MADVHVERLLELRTCPLPGCGASDLGVFGGFGEATSNSIDVAFACGARFRAGVDLPIFAVAACRTRTDTAASLLNDECTSQEKETGSQS